MKIHATAEVSPQATIGAGTAIWNNSQVREHASIGTNCILSKNVYVDAGVHIGKNVKIQNNVSVYQGVVIEDGVFIGPHVCFTNDLHPRAINPDGTLKTGQDWHVSKTLVQRGASIGANATILPNLTIGEFALIGAGSVVTKSVARHALVLGNPARVVGYVCACGKKLRTTGSEHTCDTCSTTYTLP